MKKDLSTTLIPNEILNLKLEETRKTMINALRNSSLSSLVDNFKHLIEGGKMLRARLAIRLGFANNVNESIILNSAASIEITHAASLLHDDVIDNSIIRRNAPAFWAEKGASGAILLGDVFMCQAMGLLSKMENTRILKMLISKSSEMCEAEAEQELLHRNTVANWNEAINVARRKTGSLFAFAAYAGSNEDPLLDNALIEAGYKLGTAYQLADDIFDAIGDEYSADKSLRNDIKASKTTTAFNSPDGISKSNKLISDLCNEAETSLSSWPNTQMAINNFVEFDLNPAIEKFTALSSSRSCSHVRERV